MSLKLHKPALLGKKRNREMNMGLPMLKVPAKPGALTWEKTLQDLCFKGRVHTKGNPKFQEHTAWHVCVEGTRNRAVEGTASLWTAQLRVCLLMDQSLLSVKGELS